MVPDFRNINSRSLLVVTSVSFLEAFLDNGDDVITVRYEDLRELWWPGDVWLLSRHPPDFCRRMDDVPF